MEHFDVWQLQTINYCALKTINYLSGSETYTMIKCSWNDKVRTPLKNSPVLHWTKKELILTGINPMNKNTNNINRLYGGGGGNLIVCPTTRYCTKNLAGPRRHTPNSDLPSVVCG